LESDRKTPPHRGFDHDTEWGVVIFEGVSAPKGTLNPLQLQTLLVCPGCTRCEFSGSQQAGTRAVDLVISGQEFPLDLSRTIAETSRRR
jgi:hypothetical protein